MKVGAARFIDHWVGIPVCFILSICNRIFPAKAGANRQVRKVLFLELSEMGSAILAYSAMQKIKETYPAAQLYFWIFKKNQDSVHILNIMPGENVIVMRSDNFILLSIDTIKNLWRILREHVDVVIDMELFSRFSSILTYLSGAKIRVGFYGFCLEGLYRGNLHTHKVMYNPYMHISRNFLSLVYSLLTYEKEKPYLKINLENCYVEVPKIKSTPEAKAKIWSKLKSINAQTSQTGKLVIVNPGVNEILPLRKWPTENYIKLITKILSDEEAFVVLVGTEFQSAYGQRILQDIASPRIINLIGQTSIEDLLALLDISSLLVSHDSGIIHLASLTGIQIIVLFGPETPVLYMPLAAHPKVFYTDLACSPCLTAYNHRFSRCNDNKCLKLITVEEVYSAARAFLS